MYGTSARALSQTSGARRLSGMQRDSYQIIFGKFGSLVFTILQLEPKATGRTTAEVGIVHGGESTCPAVP